MISLELRATVARDMLHRSARLGSYHALADRCRL